MPQLLVARPFHSRIATRCNILLPHVLADAGLTWRDLVGRTDDGLWAWPAYLRVSQAPLRGSEESGCTVPIRSVPGWCLASAGTRVVPQSDQLCILLPRLLRAGVPRLDLADLPVGGLCLAGVPSCTPSHLRKASENQHVPFRSDPDFPLTRARPRARERQRRNARKTSERIGTYNL